MFKIRASIYAVFIAFLFFPFPASAGEDADKITLEDVDMSKDGAVSTDEAKAYLEKLNAEYALELQKQRLEQEELENERRQNEQAATAKAQTVTFHPADANKDGIISPEEHAAYLEKTKPAPVVKNPVPLKREENVPEHLEKKYDKRLKEMTPHDANQDGVIQAEELEKKAVTDFGNADANKDGILSPGEMEASRRKIKEESLKTYDSKSQANQDAMKFKNYYRQADKNEDDQVSQEEYEAYFRGRYGKFDRDGDGIISGSEYRSDFEKLPRSYRRKQKED